MQCRTLCQWRPTLASLAVALAALSPLATPRSADADPIVYSAGHADIGVVYANGNLSVEYQFNQTTVLDGAMLGSGQPTSQYRFAPDRILTYVAPPARVTRPVGAEWDFLGVTAGEDMWVLPQSGTLASQLGVPYVGFAARTSKPSSWGSGDFPHLVQDDWNSPISFSLLNVSGPGDFSIYQTDSLGVPTASMATANGIALPLDFYNQSVPGHSHHNFAFTAPGRYEVTLLAHGQHKVDGGRWGIGTFQFDVVPEPASIALLGIGGVAMLIVARRRARQTGAPRVD